MEGQTGKQKNNLWVTIATLLIFACIVEGYFIIKERNEKIALSIQDTTKQQAMMKPPAGGGKRPAPMMVMKGQKFSDNPLSQKAYLIFPTIGTVSSDAQTALTGWDMKTTPNSDGSTQVDLIPKEAEDIKQSFTIRAGFKLYFIEATLVDDKTGVDENRGDDIGVLVSPDGIVQ
jgi:hypothetical protein